MIDELERLKRELSEARFDLIEMAPEPYRELLLGHGYAMETFTDLSKWEGEACEKIVASIEFVEDPNEYDAKSRAACPLCGAMTADWGTGRPRGWTPSGLIEHFGNNRGVSECSVFQAAWHMHRDDNAEKFRAGDRRKYEEIERRRTTEPVILLDPNDKPKFFELDFSYQKPRTEESFARARAQLRKAGFAIEQTGNVVAYRAIRDDWMMLADPRREHHVKVYVYKRSGKTRWTSIGDFRVGGTKDWPAKIAAKFQEIVEANTPQAVAEQKRQLRELKRQRQVAESRAEPTPKHKVGCVTMWDALQKQQQPE